MITPVILFIIGLLLLIKGGGWFVDGASGIARLLHLPELLIGATVVSVGTTLPEVMVSAASAVTGHGEIAYGNALGSVICNTALIAAVTIAVRPETVDKKSLWLPVIFFFASSVIYASTAYFSGFFSRWLGILLLAAFAAYIVLTVILMKRRPEDVFDVSSKTDSPDSQSGNSGKYPEKISDQYLIDVPAATQGEPSRNPSENDSFESEKNSEKKESIWKNILLLIIGAALIAFGAELLVNNGTLIAEALGVPESVIALTFVALGTSLPELVTAITSLIKGHAALSLGNVIGANLLNIVLVNGLSITLAPFKVPSNALLFGLNSSLVFEIPLMFLVMLLLTLPALLKGRLFRAQGVVLLLIYAGFCVVQFII